MFGWWRDVIREAEHEGHHNAFVLIGLRYGMALFIAQRLCSLWHGFGLFLTQVYLQMRQFNSAELLLLVDNGHHKA